MLAFAVGPATVERRERITIPVSQPVRRSVITERNTGLIVKLSCDLRQIYPPNRSILHDQLPVNHQLMKVRLACTGEQLSLPKDGFELWRELLDPVHDAAELLGFRTSTECAEGALR